MSSTASSTCLAAAVQVLGQHRDSERQGPEVGDVKWKNMVTGNRLRSDLECCPGGARPASGTWQAGKEEHIWVFRQKRPATAVRLPKGQTSSTQLLGPSTYTPPWSPCRPYKRRPTQPSWFSSRLRDAAALPATEYWRLGGHTDHIPGCPRGWRYRGRCPQPGRRWQWSRLSRPASCGDRQQTGSPPPRGHSETHLQGEWTGPHPLQGTASPHLPSPAAGCGAATGAYLVLHCSDGASV